MPVKRSTGSAIRTIVVHHHLSYIAGLLVALSGGTVAAAAEEEPARPPNVLLIVADDLGSVDLGCYGSEDLHTPHLDALADRGVRFDQFYVASPVCSPSRAALLTGRTPQRAGLTTNAGDRGLPTGQLTLAELFRHAGYRTALFGKWHLGKLPESDPLGQGFEEFFGHLGGCIDNYSHFFYWHGPNRHDLWRNRSEHFEDGAYFPDLVVREANRFLGENQDNPFFLYLPFNTPHYPLQAEREFVAMYADMKDEKRRRYAPFVTSLDAKIGAVLARLDELGLREETLVLFLSDHGHSVEERTFGGGGSAGPYRGHKGTLWEGGLRVPCIVSWPGTLPQGELREQLATSMDLLPTLCELTGIPVPEHRLDGKSIVGLLEDDAAVSPHEVVHWQFFNDWAVREGKWKLVHSKGGAFLSNMALDVTETSNLAAEHPEIVERLTQLHEAWVEEAN